jgi:ribosomal protein L18
MDKKAARLRRAAKTRVLIRINGQNRLTVFRTPRHIYAQVLTADGSRVLASCSTLEAEIKSQLKSTGNNRRPRSWVVGWRSGHWPPESRRSPSTVPASSTTVE